MGRCFSTVYRIILVVISASALVFGIMSATSCAFVKFDHQYKGDRYLLDHNRALQGDTDPVPDGADGSPESGGTQTAETPETTAETTPEATTAASVEAPAATVTEATTAASVEAPAANATIEANVTETTTAATSVETTPEATPAANLSPPSPADVPATSAPSPAGTPKANTPSGGSPGGQGSSDPEKEDTNPFGSGNDSTGAADADSGAVASATGDAGLFCEGEKDLSITNLWGGTMQDLEDKIDEESDANSSEELARNAVLAATAFGSIVVFILLLESVIGWRVCCEKWIVGLIAMVACISQGITFLFFNSERYCDGDIVNEILNQEPCVMGQGGVYSVISIVLYAITLVMACRLPQDDPFGLCCKKASARRNEGNNNDTGSSRSGFGLLGGKSGSSSGAGDDNDDNAASSGQERERPNWLSEEAKKEENEII